MRQTMRFDQDDRDTIYIPSIPERSRRSGNDGDPRHPEVNTRERSYRTPTEITFNQGEIVIQCFLNLPPMAKGELRGIVEGFRKRGHVRSVTLMLDRTISSDHKVWHFIQVNKFRRDIVRETPEDSSLAFTRTFPTPTIA